ncbi:hypothetical protein ANN_27049 [Periplaneta americana]|uniref:Uncharacterized protein n=1 Tax=Periplaneta americana TaxID=6978 RepID=A0ABQ8RWX7_PERAM|nr:hypothetical protein ANN_27049 [Periplaneta americana]
MSPGSSTESYPAFAHIVLRENPGKNVNQNSLRIPLEKDEECEKDYQNKKRNFSCAAQQLNASQSTHRFSFVNHTIKTVNMPKVRHSVNLKSKLTSYISEFKEDGLSTDNKILFCNLCQCAVSSTQKFLVQQHITTSKHQANKQLNSKQRQLFLTQPTTSNVRSEFNIDLCRSLISADIPLYKLKNKVFREFLEKYTQHTIPDESTLRKTYAPSIYDETIQKIRDEIKDSSIWVSIDETPDKEGRLVGNVVIGLLSERYSERILLHCDVLEKCNNKTIVKLFNEAMGGTGDIRRDAVVRSEAKLEYVELKDDRRVRTEDSYTRDVSGFQSLPDPIKGKLSGKCMSAPQHIYNLRGINQSRPTIQALYNSVQNIAYVDVTL